MRIAKVTNPCRCLQKDLSRRLFNTYRNAVRGDQAQQSTRNVRSADTSCALNLFEAAFLCEISASFYTILQIAWVIAMDIVLAVIIFEGLLA
jgi:hypothetical protein